MRILLSPVIHFVFYHNHRGRKASGQAQLRRGGAGAYADSWHRRRGHAVLVLGRHRGLPKRPHRKGAEVDKALCTHKAALTGRLAY